MLDEPYTPSDEENIDDEEGPSACVLVFNANDPSGAGGITADITAIASVGAHALPISTGAYVRDTAEVRDHFPMDDEAVTEQARTILEDVPVQAFKVGFVGSPENLSAVAAVASDYSDIPVVTYMPDLSWWSDDQDRHVPGRLQRAATSPHHRVGWKPQHPVPLAIARLECPTKPDGTRHRTSRQRIRCFVCARYRHSVAQPIYRQHTVLSGSHFVQCASLNALRQCSAEPATRCLPR
jgi:hypothetical protein